MKNFNDSQESIDFSDLIIRHNLKNAIFYFTVLTDSMVVFKHETSQYLFEISFCYDFIREVFAKMPLDKILELDFNYIDICVYENIFSMFGSEDIRKVESVSWKSEKEISFDDLSPN